MREAIEAVHKIMYGSSGARVSNWCMYGANNRSIEDRMSVALEKETELKKRVNDMIWILIKIKIML